MIGSTFHPFAYVSFVVIFLFAYVVIRSKTDFPGLIAGINSLSDQPWALVVIVVGCTMTLLAKQYGVSSDIATTIVGAGIGILTKKPTSKPSGDSNDHA